MDTKYIIVLDAGSSGTRSFLYKIENNKQGSLPKVTTSKSFTFRNQPGISSYYDFNKKKVNLKELFEDNVEDLFKKTLKQLKHDLKEEMNDENVDDYIDSLEIPVYIQATAGMRLLPEKAQDEILGGICDNLFDKNDDWPFKVFENKCLGNQVAIIDGQMEGVYGWLSLNYQLGTLEESNDNDITYGFMDMGGASQQIAFSPSVNANKKQGSVLKLTADNQYNLFVKTWLGFGTNQARKRYLQQLIMLNLENNNDFDDDDFTNRIIYDNCLPVNAEQDFVFNNKKFEIKGLGDFESCEIMIYPLLLKHIPCDDNDDLEGECLFNGVTVPKIDFNKDRFVGISEYYYLTKDLFDMSDKPINFITLEQNIKNFCETDYEDLKSKFPNLPDDLLSGSCFKLNWLTNVLHEGFQFPRLDIDNIDYTNDYIPFMTMGEVDDMELSWTMGKALLYATSLEDNSVGFYPEIGHPILGNLDGNKSGHSKGHPSDHITVLHSFWFLFFTIPFFLFKFFLIVTIIQIIINNLKRKNLLLTNAGTVMKFYNNTKKQKLIFQNSN
ncbi:nucleoside phosphatase GDA1/CD39 [Hanseniaspora valbyensis NRRL Y-1626]|uniref:Nucleoside phosphatase GDA1/CD39 n=1 Tax=Hanseniaspora valbyensis NRRL Y-1626 TaxID=766949 RepID=A0A1B7T8D7_9ASCO|nr:nucleoside phosphatase GDA1/CD39 [Hanseniaspora valbyensis NRRL Y-1626]